MALVDQVIHRVRIHENRKSDMITLANGAKLRRIRTQGALVQPLQAARGRRETIGCKLHLAGTANLGSGVARVAHNEKH